MAHSAPKHVTERMHVTRGFCGTARLENIDSPGDVIFVQQVSPEVLHDTLVSARFRLKARWRPLRWKYHITSGLGSLVNGIMGACWVPDTGNIPIGEGSLPWLMSQKDKVVFNVRNGGSLELPVETEFKWLDTDPTQTNGHHGYLVLFCVSPIGGLEQKAEFMITVDAHVELSVDKPPPPTNEGTGSSFAIQAFQGHTTVSGNNLGVLVQRGANLFQTDTVYVLEPPLEVRLDGGNMVPGTHAVRKVSGLVRPEVFLAATEANAIQMAKVTGNEISPFAIAGTTWTSTVWENLLVTRMADPYRSGYARAPLPGETDLCQVALGGDIAKSLLEVSRTLAKLAEQPKTIIGNLAGEVAALPADLTLEAEIA